MNQEILHTPHVNQSYIRDTQIYTHALMVLQTLAYYAIMIITYVTTNNLDSRGAFNANESSNLRLTQHNYV